jgi:ribosomal-protein-alanine N-acetyltransferase
MNSKKFPILKTDRLLLRQIDPSDNEMILFLRSDEKVNEFIERPPERMTKNLADANAFIEKITLEFENNQTYTWGIALKGQSTIIGSICLWNFSRDRKTAEIGYNLHPIFQNKGIMHEAVTAVLSYGFSTLNLDLIEAFTQFKNEASQKLLIKSGFVLNAERFDENYEKNVVFELKKFG